MKACQEAGAREREGDRVLTVEKHPELQGVSRVVLQGAECRALTVAEVGCTARMALGVEYKAPTVAGAGCIARTVEVGGARAFLRSVP